MFGRGNAVAGIAGCCVLAVRERLAGKCSVRDGRGDRSLLCYGSSEVRNEYVYDPTGSGNDM